MKIDYITEYQRLIYNGLFNGHDKSPSQRGTSRYAILSFVTISIQMVNFQYLYIIHFL